MFKDFYLFKKKPVEPTVTELVRSWAKEFGLDATKPRTDAQPRETHGKPDTHNPTHDQQTRRSDEGGLGETKETSQESRDEKNPNPQEERKAF